MGSAIKFLCVNEFGLQGTEETLRHDAAGDDVASGLFSETHGVHIREG